MKNKPTNYAPHLFIGLFLLCLLVSYPGCHNAKKECQYEYGECPDSTCVNYPPKNMNHTYETDDTQFYNAEILPPDYVHVDSLLVINADSLNWAMEYYDAASDGDIMDILRAYCYPIRHGRVIYDNPEKKIIKSNYNL